MSVQSIIQSLEKLVSVHKELLNISMEKTEIVKEGSIEKLQALLVKERKQIRYLEKAEANRQQEVEKWLADKKLSADNATITNMLKNIENVNEKEELAVVTTTLTDHMTKLKQQEALNQELLKQSIRFVQVSMDVLNPSIANINYGNQGNAAKPMKQSLFDSQA